MKQPKLTWLIIAFFVSYMNIYATDNAHFYKTANLHAMPCTSWFNNKKPENIKDWRTRANFYFSYGDTSKSWDKNSKKTTLLNSTGPYNMLYLFQNVPHIPQNIQNFANFLGNTLTELAAYEGYKFGKIKFTGDFEIWNFNLNFQQNLKKGFFVQALFPFRRLKIDKIRWYDLSPKEGIFSQQTPIWKQFKNQLSTILKNYCLKSQCEKFSENGIGDINFLIGWQDILQRKEKNDVEAIGLEFMVRAGILCPTGKERDEDHIFSLPIGYNGHWGLTGSTQIDVGILPWLTFSGFGGLTWFFDNKHVMRRVKTSEFQNGFIKLWKSKVKEEKGTLWYLGGDVKFDHFIKGLSFIVGYSYNKQEKDFLTPEQIYCNNTQPTSCKTMFQNNSACTPNCCGSSCSSCCPSIGQCQEETCDPCCGYNCTPDPCSCFNSKAVNSDSLLHGWYTHVLHFMIDYDLSINFRKKKCAPHINIFYNYPFEGRNSFRTDMIGAGIGFELGW